MEPSMKATIGEALRKRVCASSLSKVRVSDITDELGINRNTFYYHFSSKFEVAGWTFLCQLSDELSNRLPARQLVTVRFPAHASAPDELAYYTHVETGARTLDFEEFFHGLITCLLADRDYFGKLFSAQEPEFMRWASELWANAAAADIDFTLSSRYMPDPTRNVISAMLGNTYASFAQWCLKNPDEAHALLDPNVYPHWNALHNALFATIQANPTSRSGSGLPSAFNPGWR